MRLDEINNHGDDAYYEAVGKKLGEILGFNIELISVALGKGRQSSSTRTVTYKCSAEHGACKLTLSHHWEMGQSPTKPYTQMNATDANGFGDGPVDFGRFAFWNNDPAGYAEDLSKSQELVNSIENAFEG